MTYRVFLHPKAAKELSKLDAVIRRRIIARAEDLRENPTGGKQLSQSEFWNLRVGDYRIIYHINRNDERVVLLFVGHRSKVYDDFSKML